MEWIVVAALAALAFFTSLMCILALIARNRVNRRHRVDPAVPTKAPISWLVDPRTPAQLHRRLAKVGRTATFVVDDHLPAGRKRRKVEPSPLGVTAGELRAQAVLLDLQVVRLSVLASGARRKPLSAVSRSVGELETAGACLVALSAQVRAPRRLDTDDPDLTAITRQIGRLAEAHEELLGFDADTRLVPAPIPAPSLITQPPERPATPK